MTPDFGRSAGGTWARLSPGEKKSSRIPSPCPGWQCPCGWLTIIIIFSRFLLVFLFFPHRATAGTQRISPHTLGTSDVSTSMTLVLNSILMLVSHACPSKYNHLRHHKYCLQPEDVEGNCARMPGWIALGYGPVFLFRLHATALRSGGRTIRRAVRIEPDDDRLFYACGFPVALSLVTIPCDRHAGRRTADRFLCCMDGPSRLRRRSVCANAQPRLKKVDHL